MYHRRRHKTSDDDNESDVEPEKPGKPAPIVCPVCPKFFPTKGFLKWHMASAHPKPKKEPELKAQVEPKGKDEALEVQVPTNEESR